MEWLLCVFSFYQTYCCTMISWKRLIAILFITTILISCSMIITSMMWRVLGFQHSKFVVLLNCLHEAFKNYIEMSWEGRVTLGKILDYLRCSQKVAAHHGIKLNRCHSIMCKASNVLNLKISSLFLESEWLWYVLFLCTISRLRFRQEVWTLK